jgi:multicomponent Na+:H+ antiporter subunit G
MEQLLNWIGSGVVVLGLIFMLFGVFGVFRFKDYFSRVLIGGKVDTVGFLTILLGLIIRSGFNFFSGKILLVLFLYIITNPIATHAITRSAHLSGYRIKKERR